MSVLDEVRSIVEKLPDIRDVEKLLKVDPLVAVIQRARINQNVYVLTVFVQLWLTGDAETRQRLGYGIRVINHQPTDEILDPTGKVIGEYRVVNGVCQLDWIRSYDDLMKIEQAMTAELLED